MPCRWRSQISLVLGKLLIASTLVILKKLLIVPAIVLRFARDMKCILTGKERVGGKVTLLEVRNSELEWLKFEQHFIIQDSKFQKQKHKWLIKPWRPISLLNVDTKFASKVLTERLKTALPSLISSNQTAYLDGRFISERGSLISDISEVSDLLKLQGLLLTVNIEKATDSVNHNFLLKVLENYGFSHDFLK